MKKSKIKTIVEPLPLPKLSGEWVEARRITPAPTTDLFAASEPPRHPKCKGYTTWNDGDEYECGYDTTISCDECRYCEGNNGRGKDPAAKCNQG